MSVLDVLLAHPARNVQKTPEEKIVDVRRLRTEIPAEDGGDPTIVKAEFKVRALTYNEIAQLRNSQDVDAEVCLAGIVEPDLGSEALARHFEVLGESEHWGDRGIARIDLLKGMLLVGEIEELSHIIQRMSGFKKQTIFEVKKN